MLFSPQKISGFLILGLDFGYSNDPTALFVGKIDLQKKIIYVIDEVYKKSLWNNQIAELITQLGYQNQKIYADFEGLFRQKLQFGTCRHCLRKRTYPY